MATHKACSIGNKMNLGNLQMVQADESKADGMQDQHFDIFFSRRQGHLLLVKQGGVWTWYWEERDGMK